MIFRKRPMEAAKEELDRIWSNWQRMTAEQKAISEKKSMELFGVLNEENYKQLIKTYDDSLRPKHYGRKGMKWGKHIFGSRKNHKSYFQSDKAILERGVMSGIGGGGGIPSDADPDDLNEEKLKDWLELVRTDKKFAALVEECGGFPYKRCSKDH